MNGSQAQADMLSSNVSCKSGPPGDWRTFPSGFDSGVYVGDRASYYHRLDDDASRLFLATDSSVDILFCEDRK